MHRWLMGVVSSILLFGAVVGCAGSRPDVRVDLNPNVDAQRYSTYGWVEPLGTDQADYERMITTRLKEVVGAELDARGYRFDASAPDMLVNFYVNLEDKQSVSSVPTSNVAYGRGYYGYRGAMYQPWPTYEVQVREYTQGTLTVDLVDNAQRVLVWSGTLQNRVTKQAIQDAQGTLRRTVATLFDQYPYRAPSR
ncbi:MAG: DUF4136 domain-containing protein [Pseudomonadales bacterium]|jgi:hypothetical protein|nr:DUF4136 domain-containing protein [Pseudomonadales bacterium]